MQQDLKLENTRLNERIAELEEKNNFLEQIIAIMPGHVYWKNRQGELQGCNDQQAVDAGLRSRYEIIGLMPIDLINKNQPEENRQIQARKIEEADQAVMEKGVSLNLEETAVLEDGSLGYFISSKKPLFNKAGDVDGIIGVTLDVTDQRRLEEKLKQAQQEKIGGMKILAASIAHELRTPLGSVRNASEGIQHYLPDLIEAYFLAEKAGLSVRHIHKEVLDLLKESVGLIQKEMNSANTMINMLLMNIQEEIPEKYELHELSMASCIKEVLDRYPFSSEEQKSLVHWDEAENDFRFSGDMTLITHVFFNLIKNALHYIEGKPGADIHIKVIPVNTMQEMNEVVVEDTGPGIPADFLPKVFERFASKREGGTGVGLAFCQLVMGRFHGAIRCESEEGKYTRFILSFPKV